jgi:hypothetical protein
MQPEIGDWFMRHGRAFARGSLDARRERLYSSAEFAARFIGRGR